MYTFNALQPESRNRKNKMRFRRLRPVTNAVLGNSQRKNFPRSPDSIKLLNHLK